MVFGLCCAEKESVSNTGICVVFIYVFIINIYYYFITLLYFYYLFIIYL